MFGCSDGLKLRQVSLHCCTVTIAVATLIRMSADATAVTADCRLNARDLEPGVCQAAQASAALC